jgi:predicted LPLAT superfamily acyltransferase
MNHQTWQGKTRGGSLGYRFFIFLLQSFGLPTAYFFLRLVVFYFAFFAPKASFAQYHFLRKAHHFGWLQALLGVFRNYYFFGQVILDKVALMSGIKTQFTYDFEGEHFLHQLAEEGKGGLLVGAHIGNWEIAGQLLKRIKTKVHILMLDAEHQKIKELLNQSMTERKIEVIPIKSDFSHLQAIQQAFANNEFVAMHGDRFVGDAKHFYMNFFGDLAAFPTGPFYMAMKFKVPITFVSAVKESPTHYHFFATKPQLFPNFSKTEARDEQIKTILSLYIHNLELILQKFPLQWFNYYDFWAGPKN